MLLVTMPDQTLMKDVLISACDEANYQTNLYPKLVQRLAGRNLSIQEIADAFSNAVSEYLGELKLPGELLELMKHTLRYDVSNLVKALIRNENWAEKVLAKISI